MPQKIDRAAMMREAHRLFRRQLDFDPDYTFGRAIRWAAHNARARRDASVMDDIATAIAELQGDRWPRYGRRR